MMGWVRKLGMSGIAIQDMWRMGGNAVLGVMDYLRRGQIRMKFCLNGAVGDISVEMELVSRVVVGVMYWNKKCCDFQYHNSLHSRFNAWQALAKTNFHYWMENLSCAPSPIVPDLPQWVYESIVYEQPEMMGLGVGTHPADLPFFPPSDYVRLYDKLKMAA